MQTLSTNICRDFLLSAELTLTSSNCLPTFYHPLGNRFEKLDSELSHILDCFAHKILLSHISLLPDWRLRGVQSISAVKRLWVQNRGVLVVEVHWVNLCVCSWCKYLGIHRNTCNMWWVSRYLCISDFLSGNLSLSHHYVLLSFKKLLYFCSTKICNNGCKNFCEFLERNLLEQKCFS